MFNLDFSVHALRGGDHKPALYDWQTRTVWPKNIKIENTVETLALEVKAKTYIPLNIPLNFMCLIILYLLSDDVFTGVREGHPVTHMRSTNSKPRSLSIPNGQNQVLPYFFLVLQGSVSLGWMPQWWRKGYMSP